MVVIVTRKKKQLILVLDPGLPGNGNYKKLACKAVLISLSIAVSGLLMVYFWGIKIKRRGLANAIVISLLVELYTYW